MSTTTADLWNEVWAEYDARAVARSPQPRAAAAPRRRERSGLRAAWWLVALLALALAAGYVAAALLAAQQVTRALGSADTATLAQAVDWSAVEASLAGRLLASAHELPTGRTAGLTPAGLDFLQGMAREVTAGIATQDGLAELVRRRLGLPDLPDAQLAAPHIQPESLTSTRLVLASADGEEGAVTLTLALTDPLRLRWQVVGVELAERAEF